MGLIDRIEEDSANALRQGDKNSLSVLRMLKSDLKYKKIELGRELTDADCLAVLTAAAKQRKDAIREYRRGARDDLVNKEQAELGIIKKYLPEEMGEEELVKLIDEVIAETDASGPGDIGVVMQAVMPKVKGRADGRKVNELVLKKLRG